MLQKLESPHQGSNSCPISSKGRTLIHILKASGTGRAKRQNERILAVLIPKAMDHCTLGIQRNLYGSSLVNEVFRFWVVLREKSASADTCDRG